ncbi:hypothetical protein ACTHPH_23170 [Paenibacillus pasadenensis]|uniref:Uncharacterized protein n=1 Tax=Paenibacillus pasadenensis TaxID=217090 RepID=A0A2N5N0W1_9BACL|nr:MULTISPECIES: hypothetical protein [Paenibacillus]PLT43978.1 hypothetical protein B8V81_2409 [Paenibacillus pasadenensis]QGG54540.1 hypothetical protein GE073_02265 [Paenibacillus sp. B01]
MDLEREVQDLKRRVEELEERELATSERGYGPVGRRDTGLGGKFLIGIGIGAAVLVLLLFTIGVIQFIRV